MPSQLNLWIVFPQNPMVTFYFNFLLCVIHWDILDNYKVWIESMMVMFGASCKLVTSKICLDWVSEWPNALDICVVEMIFVLCFNVLMNAMKLTEVAIVHSYQYLGSVSWNPWSISSIISSVTLCPLVYKLVVAECIMLFTNFQIFQEPWSTWVPIYIYLQERTCRDSFQEMKNLVVYEVCHMLTTTYLTIALSMIKAFIFHHLFHKDGECPMELLKGEKLNSTLLKFVPLCFFGIRNLIVSLKHWRTPNSFDGLNYESKRWKQQKDKELGHIPWFVTLWG
jgi:hypothetical protein